MVPDCSTAASFVPSLEEVIAFQKRLPLACAVHVIPELVEVYICPPDTAAASFVPSAEEAMDHQVRLPLACAVHVIPELVEVYI